MTHGEEYSSDMHQDSVVLTYLESVLMHRAATASAAGSLNKSSPDGSARPAGGSEGVVASAPGRPPAPSPPRAARTGPALNVKKARLLQSEGWSGAKRRKVVGQEGRCQEQSQQQPHSTLLASLLQSFSSSLQDQQRRASPGSRSSSPEQEDEDPGTCGRLGPLLDGRGGDEEPRPVPGAPRLSCSARLKAVASMVGKGTGTPSSPKPSAACSQLALLLSSDCQLQQYSRARSLAPSASQRLAAIASKKLAGAPQERPAGKSPSSSAPSRDRVTRSPASPGAGSSLLMHLLNTPKPLAANGHAWVAAAGEPASRPRSRPPKEGGEDGGGGGGGGPMSRSNCAPMDLSTKTRVCEPVSLHSGSLEQMTESLLFSWNPKVPGLKGPEPKEDGDSADAKSHQKVTLLQLLLGHQQGSRTPEPSGEAPPPATLSRRAGLLEPFPPPPSLGERRPPLKPRCTLGGRRSQHPPADCPPRTYPAQGEPPPRKSQPSPANEPAKAHRFLEQPLACESPRAAPFPKQLFPLELRQSSPCAPVAPLAGDGRISNFSFSASKLLHDLAHTGSHKSPDPSQMDAELRGSLEPKLGKDCAGGHPLSFQLSDPGTGQERGAGAGDLEHLLERRSVLQLLLRSPDKEQIFKGHPQDRRGEQGALESRSSSEAISMVKVKTEPTDEEEGVNPFCKAEESTKCQRAAPGGAAESPLPRENLKQEVGSPRPLSPPAPSHARGGVLSQLLRHSSAPPQNYLSSGQPGLEAPAAPSNPCPVPRMRHLLLGSTAERRDLQKKPERPVALNGHAFCSNGMPGARGSCKQVECRPGNGGAEAEPRGYLKDTQGFNVLKQLLLSENGIKVLSQHRTLQNGGSARDPSDPKAPGGTPAPFYREPDVRRGGKESPVQLPGYPGTARLPQPQKGAHPEPPWLTKANPILYYMLQRGGGEVQPFGLSAPRASEGDAPRKERKRPPQRPEAESRAGLGWVKEEPEEPLACSGSRHDQLPPSPGQILEKVAAIKREPD
ncbi:nuclear receptor-interacting protein 1 [Pristis pectinata]|uniref:nuclear receptor-interacting protein 1 n=1 Tax=Pristis pectinata TaxID=685728 RepID=UPI00223CBF8D|nr:nuclear receptor-interacting protein 1 [Pristis pectinata]XP_051871198.1 nuclear receptor-interacting protein 1 [Pristis pectinata]XP_051871199.1 nuclear receptor-interacting protein 1 [Pristis pectinata]